jgi:integrase
MANIYRRGKTWWGRIQRDGQEFRRSLQTRSQSIARKRLAKWLDRLETQGWGEKEDVTLNAIADQFINKHLPNTRYQSARRYGVSLGHLDRLMGHKMLARISSADLVEFESERRSEGASAPTVRRDLACLSSLFGFAIEREIVEHNPIGPFLKRAKKRGLRESEARTRYLKKMEEAKLLAAAVRAPSKTGKPNKRKTSGPRNDMMLKAAIVVAIHSGLRLREQFDLVWTDLDLPARLARIPAARTKGRRTRDVVLFEPAIAALQSLPRHFKSPYVFWHRDGQKFLHMDRGFKAAAKRGGLSDLRWHDLRRTHGCRLLQERGWSIEMVQAQLGHQTVTQTQKAYAFLEVEQRLARADKCAVVESEGLSIESSKSANSAMNTNGTRQ